MRFFACDALVDENWRDANLGGELRRSLVETEIGFITMSGFGRYFKKRQFPNENEARLKEQE